MQVPRRWSWFLLGFVLISSWGSLGGFHFSHDTERTQHTRWSLGNLDNRGSLMKVKNNRELNQFYLRAIYTRSYSHFSGTNFDNILFLNFLSIQTVSCLTLWSDNHQWTSQLLINTLFKYKRKELKGNLGAWKGRVRTHIFLEFLKKYSLLHTLQVLFRMCRRQEDEVGFSSGLCWHLLGVE